MVNVITDNIDIWTGAQIPKTNGRGRGPDNQSLHGIKKLRELILELAVRGKLVSQDANDEPASVLLEKIAKEKARLIKEHKIKKQKALPEIKVEEVPFNIPKGWQYVRLNDLGEWGAGATPLRGKHEYYGGSIPWFKSGELVSDYISHSEEFITDLALKETSLRYNKIGDVLIAMYGATIGKTSILKVQSTTNQAVCACTPFNGIYNVFLLTLFKGYKNRFIEMGAGGAQPNISREKIIATIVALPPLAEQHRIVAKVDELMALCDQLEQQQTDSNTAHQTLVETLLATLTSAADQGEFIEAWQRVANHFNTLFTTEHSIDQLKQAILQLAVMGKLVPQDPNDEPARILLGKIAKEKAGLVKEGKIKKEKPLSEISEDEKPFELPKGWAFARLGNIANRIGSGSTPSGGQSAYVESGVPFLRSQNVWNHGLELGDVAYITEKTHEKMSNTVVQPNDILLNITGASLGRCAIYPDNFGEANVSQHVTIIRPTDSTIRLYLHLCILSPYTQRLVWGRQVGMAREGLSKKVLELFEIPLPPLAEQHRIVAKVTELMVMCETLKELLNDAQTTQVQLADAIVEQSVESGRNI
jgi:type I restriction enzyme, S subunit